MIKYMAIGLFCFFLGGITSFVTFSNLNNNQIKVVDTLAEPKTVQAKNIDNCPAIIKEFKVDHVIPSEQSNDKVNKLNEQLVLIDQNDPFYEHFTDSPDNGNLEIFKTFSDEAIDPDWGPITQDEVEYFITSHSQAHLVNIEFIECRTTKCEIKAHEFEQGAWNRIMDDLYINNIGQFTRAYAPRSASRSSEGYVYVLLSKKNNNL